jgi:hypothetical protein
MVQNIIQKRHAIIRKLIALVNKKKKHQKKPKKIGNTLFRKKASPKK